MSCSSWTIDNRKTRLDKTDYRYFRREHVPKWSPSALSQEIATVFSTWVSFSHTPVAEGIKLVWSGHLSVCPFVCDLSVFKRLLSLISQGKRKKGSEEGFCCVFEKIFLRVY